MADILADVIRIETTKALMPTTLKNQQLGYTSDTFEIAYKTSGGTMYYWSSTSGVLGSGTPSYVPFWIDSTTQGNSIITSTPTLATINGQLAMSGQDVNGVYYDPGSGGDRNVAMDEDGNVILKSVSGSIDYQDFNGIAAPSFAEGRVWYDSDKKALSYYTSETESNMQIGFEEWTWVYNSTGSTIINGTAVYLNGFDATSGLPTVALANAGDHTTSRSYIGIATHDIETGSRGIVLRGGTLRDYDTSTFTTGDVLWLDTTDGMLSTTRPEAPALSVRVGIVGKVDASVGTVEVSIQNYDTLKGITQGWNGAILEQHTFTVTESAGTVYANLEKSGGGDLHLVFNGEYTDFDATPIAQVALTAGSDTAPTLNYVYIPESTGVLTASTSGWPSAQHVPVGTVVCQSAASVATDGPYKVHAWTDHVTDGNSQGHVSHLNRWIREQYSTWLSGVVLTPTLGAGVFDIATTSGIILQLHSHAFPAFNTAATSNLYVYNNLATPYNKVGDLTTSVTDSIGGSLSGRHYSLVLWGVVNEATGDCKLMVNLPSGSYTNSSNAIADLSKYTNYSIPTQYKGVGFLIARLTVSNSGGSGGTFALTQQTDLRGLLPATSAGGATGVAGSEFSDNLFRVFNVTDSTKKIAFSAGSIATGTTRTITMPDQNITLGTVSGTAGYVGLFSGTNTIGNSVIQQSGTSVGLNTVPDVNFHVKNATSSCYIKTESASGLYDSAFSAVNGSTLWRGGILGATGIGGTTWELYANSATRLAVGYDGKVGIGVTAAPTFKLQVHNSAIGDYARFSGDDASGARGLVLSSSTTTNVGDTHTIQAQSATGVLAFKTSSTEAMRIDSSGNVGIGTTPRAWNSAYTSFDVGGNCTYAGITAQGANGKMFLAQNAYVGASAWTRISTDEVSIMDMSDGEIRFRVAPSGAAGSTFSPTVIMTLDNNGCIGINTLTPDRRLEIIDSTAPQARFTHTDASKYIDLKCDSNSFLTFTGGNTAVVMSLGADPEAWATTGSVNAVGLGDLYINNIGSETGFFGVSQYYSSTGWKRGTNLPSSRCDMAGGFFRFQIDKYAGEAADTAITNMWNLLDIDIGEVVVNEGGNDVDFRVEGDTVTNLLQCDAANDQVIVGNGSLKLVNATDDVVFVNAVDGGGALSGSLGYIEIVIGTTTAYIQTYGTIGA